MLPISVNCLIADQLAKKLTEAYRGPINISLQRLDNDKAKEDWNREECPPPKGCISDNS